MSYDLFNESTSISRTFSRQSWGKLLELAMLYGWRPMGTCPPPHLDFQKLNADWLGRYFTNDGQIVSRVDAFALADSLEKSLDEIPKDNIKIDWNARFWTDEDDLPEWLTPDEKEFIQDELEFEFLDILGVHPFEFFAGDAKHDLISFIRFCKLGSFIIT
jgi:hypothetical protein